MNEVVDLAEAEKRARQKASRLVPFDQIKLGTARNYLVKGLIPKGGLVVIWGPPTCGKSFWALDIVMHIALGWEYRGRKVDQGPVVYVACEGHDGMPARKEAFKQRFMAEDTEGVAFYLVNERITLQQQVEDLIGWVEAENVKPAAIVLDTLNQSLDGSESSDQDMGGYIKAAGELKARFGCAVILIHHCGHDQSRPRGHTSLRGACDAQLAVARDHADRIGVTVEKMKDGPDGTQIYSALESVEVGLDEDGESITSCVVIPSDVPEQCAKQTRKLGKNEQTMLDILAEHMPGGLTQEHWNDLARQDGIGTRRRADLHDCRRRLKAKKLVHDYSDKWFITPR